MGHGGSSGIPIRLVRRDGKLIPLECTNYTIAITRGINIWPVYFTGERLGTDINLVSCSIRLECILLDDDCGAETNEPVYGRATLDFSTDGVVQSDNSRVLSLSPYMDDDGGSVVAEDLDKMKIEIVSTDETKFIITLSNTTATVVSGNNITINITTVGSDSASNIVSSIHSALTNTIGSSNQVYANFQAKMNVTKAAGAHSMVAGDGMLIFTQKLKGSLGGNDTPVIITSDVVGLLTTPALQTFSYATDATCMSSGDKAQNLIGTAVNNTIAGIAGDIFAGDWGPGGTHTEGLIRLGTEKVGTGEWGGVLTDAKYSDYIIGIQIPYNSLSQETLADVGDPVQGYNARNFIMVTGFNNRASIKGSEANIQEASSIFDINDKYTGISGTITACDITYDAGETIYRAEVTFQPLDAISGV